MSQRSFQCSSASRKFLNHINAVGERSQHDVSVLFSEPKIPQSRSSGDDPGRERRRFSALQRAENSSILSSAPCWNWRLMSFSALQRAENSSIYKSVAVYRVFLYRFSALQRAENSSIRSGICNTASMAGVSVLFSEPKIPQFWRRRPPCEHHLPFQCSSASRKFLNFLGTNHRGDLLFQGFSALQRAENSSIRSFPSYRSLCDSRFSALQRAENSSITKCTVHGFAVVPVSVLFSEPKIPQF